MTSLHYTYGVPCKLGDGYNKQFHRFYDFDAKAQVVSSEAFHSTHLAVPLVTISDSYIPRFWLGGYMDEAIQKTIECGLISDAKEYYCMYFNVLVRKESCRDFERFHDRTAHHVVGLQYGMFLQLVVEKTVFPDADESMAELMTLALDNVDTLTWAQRRAQCKVLINVSEKREMTLEQVLRFKNEYNVGLHREYEMVVVAEVEEHRTTEPQTVRNELNFTHFLSNLYACFRKLELQLEAAHYPGVLPGSVEESMMVPISCGLVKAKNEFRVMDRTDFFKMYPVMKALFQRYTDYLSFVIKHNLDIDESDSLPGSFCDFTPWLVRLNTWRPVCVGDKWYGYEGSILVTPPGFESVKERMTRLAEGIVVQEDAQLTEPHLFLQRHQGNGLFGFVDMSGAAPPPAQKTASPDDAVLSIPCPENCTADKRKWVCQQCGSLIRIDQIYLTCTCGLKFCDKQFFNCNNPRHSNGKGETKSSADDKMETEISFEHVDAADEHVSGNKMHIF